MTALELFLCAFALFTATTAFVAAMVTIWHYRSRPAPDGLALRGAFPHGLPRVSILKPCKGADPSLYENLASFLRLDGVPYEVLIGVADPADPAAAIARTVVRNFPHRDVRLVITGDRPGHNPKVVNLIHLMGEARGELIYVADSNVRVPPDLLRRLVAPFAEPRVALSYAMFRGLPGRDLGARIQAAIFSTLGLPSICSAYRVFGFGNLVGKSFVLRRSALEAMGGFDRYERLLMEDGLIGRDVRRLGFLAALADVPVDVHLGEMGLRTVWSQQLRWAVLQRFSFPTLPLGQLVWNPFFIGLLAVGAWHSGLELAASLLAAAALHNQLVDLIPFVRFGGRLRDGWVLVAADALMFGIVCSVWFHREVVWRGQRFTLGKDTLVLAAAPAETPPVRAPAQPVPWAPRFAGGGDE